MARHGVSALVAVAVGGAALLASWSVQAAVLPRPPRGDVAAADAVIVLREHRLVASVLRIDGDRSIHAVCARGWFPDHGTLLRLGDGVRLFAPVRAAGVPSDPLATAELELAGCPHVLETAIARLLGSGARVQTARAWLGRPALAVHLHERSSLLTIYLTPRRFIPIGVALDGPILEGESRIRFVR